MNRYGYCNSILFIITAVILCILFTPNKIYTDEYPLGGFIGLFTDEQLDECWVETAPNTTFDMWMFIWAWDNGALGVDLSVQYCDNVVQVEEIFNPLVLENSIYGNLDDGFTATFEECQDGWVWVVRQTLYITDEEMCVIRVSGAPGLPLPGLLGCDDNYYYLEEYSMLFITLSTESSSWGAIKSLYK